MKKPLKPRIVFQLETPQMKKAKILAKAEHRRSPSDLAKASLLAKMETFQQSRK